MQLLSFERIVGRLNQLPGPEPRVVVSGNFAAPAVLVRALGDALERCRVFTLNAQPDWPQHAEFISETPFVGPGVRHDPMLDYLPMRLSLVPRLFDSVRPVDAVLLHTSVPHRGKVSLGIEVNILPAAVEHARARGALVVAQLNPQMPYTFGDSELPIDWIDCAIDGDQRLASQEDRAPDEREREIGTRIARFADDGTTLQLGIGLIPTVAATKMSHLRHLRAWSEMLSDGVLVLERSGSLDPDQLINTSFLMGSPELYAWADRNPRLRMSRTEIINDPARIASHPNMLSINAAMQIDLFAQANASFIEGVIHSGFGGQPDFVTGALHSPGGHAVVGLHAWHDKTDASAVLPILTNPVTSFQHSAIISEHGCADVFGRSQHAQARLIIEYVADPRARRHLFEAAARLGLRRDADPPVPPGDDP
ncbi:MAG: acetyl-CoA hydrolase/transferase family protein [Acidimicrobiales bacterium]